MLTNAQGPTAFQTSRGSGDNPFDYSKPVDPLRFVGRKDIIDDILGHPKGGHSVWKPGAPTSFAIIGQEGIGKTSLLRLLNGRLRKISQEPASQEINLMPIYIDLNEFTPNSRRVVYKVVATLIFEDTMQNRPELVQAATFDELRQPISSENVADEELEALSARHFKEGLKTLDQRCNGTLRLVCLIDGADTILSKEWGIDLLKNLRHLIQDRDDIPDVLALVLAWTPTQRRRMATQASGLEGNVTVHQLCSLSLSEVRELARQAGEGWLNEEMTQIVYILGGGQPRLTQYLLKTLWERRQSLDHGQIRNMVSQASIDLETMFWKWARAFDDVAERIYLFLALRSLSKNPKSRSVTRKELEDGLRLEGGDASFALDVLRSTGVVAESSSGFAAAGVIFRDWLLKTVPPSYLNDIKILAQPSRV